MPRVAIVQPWLPQYRVPFFELLRERLHLQGIEVDVFHGDPPPSLRARGDGSPLPGAIHLPTRVFRMLGRDVRVKSLRPLQERWPYDLVIAEQAVGNLETYQLLAGRARDRVAFWGHGRTYVKPVGLWQRAVSRWLTNRGQWFFAYTDGGAAAVRAGGFPSDRVTVVNNSIDSSALTRLVADVDPDDLERFREEHDLRGRTALYIGGLDEDKRLPFLLDCARAVHEQDPDFRLLVAGNGEQVDLVREAAASQQWVTYLGSVSGPDKGLAFSASQVLAMPGRVGLVAVDSFAAGLPVVTTDWPWHAPEFEYLVDGVNCRITPDDPQHYSDGLAAIVANDAARSALSSACRASGVDLTVEAMARRYADGVVRAVDCRHRQEGERC